MCMHICTNMFSVSNFNKGVGEGENLSSNKKMHIIIMNTYENRMDAWLTGPFFEIKMPTQNPFYHGKLVILYDIIKIG